jgi:hypothetical protein
MLESELLVIYPVNDTFRAELDVAMMRCEHRLLMVLVSICMMLLLPHVLSPTCAGNDQSLTYLTCKFTSGYLILIYQVGFLGTW